MKKVREGNCTKYDSFLLFKTIKEKENSISLCIMVKAKVEDMVEYTLKYNWKLQRGMINYNYFLYTSALLDMLQWTCDAKTWLYDKICA